MNSVPVAGITMRTFLYILTTSSALTVTLLADHAQRMERGLKLFENDVATLRR